MHEGRNQPHCFFASEQRRLSPVERDHMGGGVGAVNKDVLLILYIISIAQVTSRGGAHRYCESRSLSQFVGCGH